MRAATVTTTHQVVHHHPLAGESLAVAERLVVAPAAGIFRSAPLVAGTAIDVGDRLGDVVALGDRSPILSAFRGTLMGMLAHDGERLRAGQAVAWLRAT